MSLLWLTLVVFKINAAWKICRLLLLRRHDSPSSVIHYNMLGVCVFVCVSEAGQLMRKSLTIIGFTPCLARLSENPLNQSSENILQVGSAFHKLPAQKQTTVGLKSGQTYRLVATMNTEQMDEVFCRSTSAKYEPLNPHCIDVFIGRQSICIHRIVTF